VIDLIKQCEAKREQTDFHAALPICLNAVEAAEKLGDLNYLSIIYTDLGNEYDALGNYQKAIEFHAKALQIDMQVGAVGNGKATGTLTTAVAFSDPFFWAPFILIGDWR
jgi:tetratricopeptide (TPR) repeat protein